jgi:serine/threonine protein kinase
MVSNNMSTTNQASISLFNNVLDDNINYSTVGPENVRKYFKDTVERNSQNGGARVEKTTRPKLAKQFTFEKDLGKGKYARVLKARDNNANRDVAIKYMNFEDEEAVLYAVREAKILEKAMREPKCHPNIVCSYGQYTTDTHMFLITEFIDGRSLYDITKQTLMFLRNSENELKDFFFFCIQIMSALKFLHDKGIVHRDLHAENIIVQNNKERVKIIDFGLACYVPQEEPVINCIRGGRTQLHYTPPELLKKRLDNDTEYPLDMYYAGDIWALGITLHYAVTGSYPLIFQGGSSGMQIAKRMLNEIETNFSIKGCEFNEINELLEGMLEEDPEERWTASECLEYTQNVWLRLNKNKTVSEKDIKPMTHLWGVLSDEEVSANDLGYATASSTSSTYFFGESSTTIHYKTSRTFWA